MSPDKKSKGPWPICHTYRKQHEGGWELCDQITKKVRANISKLVTASTFNNKSNRSSSNGGGNTTTSRTFGEGMPTKRGKLNKVVKEESDPEGTKTGEDGMHIQDHHLQMFGVTNTVIGHVNFHPKSQPPRPKDNGTETPWRTWVLPIVRLGVPLVMSIMRIKIKECRSRKRNGKSRE